MCRTKCHPQDRRGEVADYAIASFDGHTYCAHCRDKGKGDEPCIANKETSDCKFCNALTPERVQLATPSYKLKKEKQEAKRTGSSNPTDDSSLVDPSSVSIIGVAGDCSSTQASTVPPEKKSKKEFQLNLRNLLNLLQLIARSQSLIRSGRNASTDLKLLLCPSLSNQPSHQMLELCLHTLHLLTYLRIQNLFSS